ncbi:MAG: hypothetical protein ACOX0E_08210 [Syntrophomonadaceae bacterium]|jgi:hypothetical protein
MDPVSKFQLIFKCQEKHLLLPTTTSIVLAQNLYDLLFQYVIDPDKEKKLLDFIKMLEQHIKSNAKVPFSVPVAELSFLQEGLNELRMLNWREVPVSVFEITVGENDENSWESVLNHLEGIIIFSPKPGTNEIYVYPNNLIRI